MQIEKAREKKGNKNKAKEEEIKQRGKTTFWHAKAERHVKVGETIGEHEKEACRNKSRKRTTRQQDNSSQS